MQPLFVCSKKDMKNDIDTNKRYYIQIADWMLEFKLPINVLLVYAIVYGYCQSGDNCYHGSTKTIAKLLGLGEKGKGHASEYLNELEKRKLLRKEEIKENDKQKYCKYYVTTNYTGKVEDQDVDYITIQPWMLPRFRNAMLIIYARIQNLSRNRNSYIYDPEDLKFWTGQNCTNKDMRRRYIKKLIEQNAIELSDENSDLERYRAIIPDEIKQSGKNGTPVAKMEHHDEKSGINGTVSGKNGTNNHNTLNVDNLNYVVVKEKIKERCQTVIFSSNEWARWVEAGDFNIALGATKRLMRNIENQTKIKLQQMLELTDKQIIKLFEASVKANEDIFDTFNNPDGYIVSCINKEIEKNQIFSK